MAVRVETWPFILRDVRLHENRWEFERSIMRRNQKAIGEWNGVKRTGNPAKRKLVPKIDVHRDESEGQKRVK